MDADFKSLADVLQSGGNAATLIIAWLAYKIIGIVRAYLTSLQATLASLVASHKVVEKKLDLLLDDNHERIDIEHVPARHG